MGVSAEQFVRASPPISPWQAEPGLAVDAVIVVDADLRVVAWDGNATELYGIPADESQGLAFTDHVSCYPCCSHTPLDRCAWRNGDFDDPDYTLEEAGLVDGPAMHVVGSGRRIPVRVSVLTIHPSSGERLHVLVVKDDTAHLGLAASLQARLDFEMLLSELCARFSNVSEEELDAEIELWLARLAAAMEVDRSSFAELRSDGLLVVTHAYAAPGLVAHPLGPV